MGYISPLFAAILPFLVWPLELVLPYPYLVEEVAKLLVVCCLISTVSNKPQRIYIAIACGVMFSISELVFYLMNIALVGGISTIFGRFLVTAPMHTLTFVILTLGLNNGRYWLSVALLVSICVHYLFNLGIARWFSL